MTETVKKTTTRKPKTETVAKLEVAAKPETAAKPKKAATKTNGKANGVSNGTTNGKLDNLAVMPSAAPPSYEQIAALAHRYWAERGYQHGNDAGDWLRAEQELRGMAS
jgi:hypothetical protein